MSTTPPDSETPQETQPEPKPRKSKPPGFFQKYMMPSDIMEWVILIFMITVCLVLFVLLVMAFRA